MIFLLLLGCLPTLAFGLLLCPVLILFLRDSIS